MKRLWGVVAVVAALGTFFGVAWLVRAGLKPSGPAAARTPSGNRLFTSVLETVQSYAVDSLDRSTIFRLAAAGMLLELNDPYAGLVSSRDSLTAARVGPPPVQGLYLDRLDDEIVVVTVVPNSPGDNAGIQAGDVVLRVGTAPVVGPRVEDVARQIDGASGSTIRLRLARASGPPPIAVTLVRGPVSEPPLPTAESLGGGIAILRIPRVDSIAAARVGRLVDSLTSTGARGLVLDLRGAIEGRLEDGVSVAARFLDRGQPVVTRRSRSPADSATYRAAGSTTRDVPLVVLIDRGTAGAAELIAAALQDHDRAAIVGETSFGRGVSVSVFPLGDGRSVRLSTALWVSPSGRLIQRMPAPPLPPGSTDTTNTRPAFRTDGGRTVLGGGGVVPDREVGRAAEASRGDDPILAAAKELLGRSPTRKALIAALAAR